MEEKIGRGSGFSFWDKVIRNPIVAEIGVDVTEGFEASAMGSSETASVGMLIGQLADVFGVGGTNQFATKDVFLAIADEHRLAPDEKIDADELRKGVENQCRELRDTMIMINGRAALSLKSAGHVLSSLANRISGNMKFVRHQTRSKCPIKHWIENIEEATIE